jgi:hypothetical protein
MLGEAGKPTIIMSLKYAHRWRVQRRRVRIIVPDQGLSDINGVLQQGAGWHGQSDYQPSQNFLKHKDPNGGTQGPQLQDSDLSAGQSRVQMGPSRRP